MGVGGVIVSGTQLLKLLTETNIYINKKYFYPYSHPLLRLI